MNKFFTSCIFSMAAKSVIGLDEISNIAAHDEEDYKADVEFQ